MMKKRKSMMRFAFNLFWLLPVSMLVLFACSSPKGEEDMQGNEMVKNRQFRNVELDSVSVKVVIDEKEDVYFLLYLGKERHVKFDIYHRNSSFKKTLADANWEPGEVVIVWYPDKYGITESGEYNYKLEADHDVVLKGSFAIKATNPEKASAVSNEIFVVVDQQPEFAGGMSKLYKYLSETINYPERAKRDSIQGRVFVSFIVEKDGSITDVKLLRGIGSGCDEEAVRAVAEMPNWKPGEMKGKSVRVRFNLPIKFTLK